LACCKECFCQCLLVFALIDELGSSVEQGVIKGLVEEAEL
jgi:hypothetical protein